MSGGEPGILVTTSLRAKTGELALARQFSLETGLPLVERRKLALGELLAANRSRGAVVVEAGRVVYTDGQGEFFFHPGMAVVRINELRGGKKDQMIAAMDLYPGQRVLDCTLGLGSDAIVASYVTGAEGRVVGLESSPLIAALVRHGMQNYQKAGQVVRQAMQRVIVQHADHRDVLQQLPPASYDVVYLDPMFRRPLVKSSGINALRPLADYRAVTPEVIALALRVAKRRLVVKDNRQGDELKRLGCPCFAGGSHSPAVYGIWNK